MIENYPWIAIALVGALFTLGSATVGDTRLDPPPEPHPAVVVHTPAADPLPTATAVRLPAIEVATTTTSSSTTTTTTIPPWTGPIAAHYGPGSACTPEQATIVAHHYWWFGASDATVEWALGMISRESTCDSAAHNGNRASGDDSWGICQINALAGWFNDGQLLGDVDRTRFATDFEYNVHACARLWSACGRGPWNYGDYYCRPPTS